MVTIQCSPCCPSGSQGAIYSHLDPRKRNSAFNLILFIFYRCRPDTPSHPSDGRFLFAAHVDRACPTCAARVHRLPVAPGRLPVALCCQPQVLVDVFAICSRSSDSLWGEMPTHSQIWCGR